MRPSRAKPPFDPEKFQTELVQQLKEEMKNEMLARSYNIMKAKEERDALQKERLRSLASKNYNLTFNIW